MFLASSAKSPPYGPKKELFEISFAVHTFPPSLVIRMSVIIFNSDGQNQANSSTTPDQTPAKNITESSKLMDFSFCELVDAGTATVLSRNQLKCPPRTTEKHQFISLRLC